MLTKTQDHGCCWLAGWLAGRSVGKVFGGGGGDGFYETIIIIISFDSVVVVIGRTAGRPRVRSSSRPCAILSGTWLFETLVTRGVVRSLSQSSHDGLPDINTAVA
jgi:hypothetical protein